MEKKLGVWMLTALVVGNMVGSGVFLLPASLASFGSISLLSWVATAIGAIFLALVFAKLSTLFPKTGGPYIYCKEGFGPFIGLQVAFNYWVYIWVGNAAIAVAFAGYLATFFPSLAQSEWLSFCVAAGAIWFFTAVNVIGVHFAGRFQLVLTLLKFVPLLLIACITIFFIDLDNLRYFNVSGQSTAHAFSGGAMLTLWAFLGMESASIPANCVQNPKKTIPRATILGTSLAAVLYILSTVAIMGVIPVPQLQNSTAPFADLAGKIFGAKGRYLMGGAAVISCLGALNGWILLQGQIPLAAAKDRLFPRCFAKTARSHAPIFGIVSSSTLATLLLLVNCSKNLVDQFTFIISLATFFALIAYLYTSIVEFAVYSKHPAKMNKKTVTKTLTISTLAFLYAFWAVMSAGKEVVFYGVLLMFASIPLYGWIEWQKHRKATYGKN